MILPPRPLRLDPLYLRDVRFRLITLLAPGLVLCLVGVWPGHAAYELVADQQAWRDGEPLAVATVETHVSILAVVSRHVRITATFAGDDGAEWLVRDDYYTLFTDSVGDGPLEARYDASSQRIALSWSMDAAPWRWAWILFFGLGLLGLSAVSVHAAWCVLRELRIARAAARGGEEIELEVLRVTTTDAEDPDRAAVHVTYRIPPPVSRAPVGYRTAAAGAPSVRTEEFALRDRAPIWLDGGSAVLALRPDPRRSDVTVLSHGFWPLLLEPAARDLACARLESRASRVVDDPPA
ncbi:MAG TPA: hypothetical protein ENK57_07680 [Polyangiaceae bacterium]|nr:hypothetical protein [Polyangiaceae bacterium]